MKTHPTISAFLFLTFILSALSCRKDSPNEVIIDPVYYPDLVKTIKWGNTGQETYIYNPDSTIKTTVAGSPGTTTMTREFKYTNKRLTQIIKSDLMEENFEYSAQGRVSSITEKLRGSTYPGTRLEFEYNTDQSLKQMKYYEFDDLRNILKSSTNYEYDNQKRPTKIVTTSESNPGTKVIFDIENYSEEVFINPWPLIEPWHLVAENFQIYNYPFLSSQRRLPLKVTKKIEVNNVIQETETETYTYEIKDYRLESILYNSNKFKITYEY